MSVSSVKSVIQGFIGKKKPSIFKAYSLKVMFEGNNAQFLWEKCINERLSLTSALNIVFTFQGMQSL